MVDRYWPDLAFRIVVTVLLFFTTPSFLYAVVLTNPAARAWPLSRCRLFS